MLTRRTIFGSALLLLVVGGVIGLLALAIDHQHEAARRARVSQTVISAANLTQQRLLAVQTNIRGYLIRGNRDVLVDYRIARAALPDATLDLQTLVERDPAQARRADQIRQDALSYVNDYGDPVVARTREDGVSAGRAFAAANDGGARADGLLKRIEDLTAAEQVQSEALARKADAWSDRALLMALLGLIVCVIALALVTAYVARRIVMPVGRLAAAAERMRRGELDVEVPVARGRGEIGRLGTAFNSMARALEQSRDELESQNTELEMQAIALEERQEELSVAGDEARAQRDELSRTAGELEVEVRRAALHVSFADRLAASRDVEELARVALETLAETAGADVGVLYAENWRDDTRWARAAVLGLEPAPLAEHAMVGGEGAGARAVSQRDVVYVGADAAGLRVKGLGGELSVRWELHVPLSIGARPIGVATLGGVSVDSFDAAEAGTVQRLASQAAVALAEAGAAAQRNWLSQVNAAVLGGIREGIALVGLDHELVFANAAMEELAARLSMPIGVAIAARGADLDMASVDREAYFADWEAILADTDEPTADELVVGGMALERYTAPIDDTSGERLGRLVVLRDVTRERDAERLKNDLMATVSHELRTPLASVLGYAELLRTRKLEPAERAEILATVHREARRLSALIDDFLDLQAIEQDRFALNREPFSVLELLYESVGTFAGQSTEHVLEVIPAGDAVTLTAFADRARIAQVVANLLSNAIKYSPEGGLVRVDVARESGVVRISVADQGIGIPSAERSRVFEKFFRASHPGLRVGGTGLGLALAHEIVRAHGGTMGFESVEGEGSTFWFTLPAAS